MCPGVGHLNVREGEATTLHIWCTKSAHLVTVEEGEGGHLLISLDLLLLSSWPGNRNGGEVKREESESDV